MLTPEQIEQKLQELESKPHASKQDIDDLRAELITLQKALKKSDEIPPAIKKKTIKRMRDNGFWAGFMQRDPVEEEIEVEEEAGGDE